jgi:protein-S-isoprenylcysteine O-methyltransferase Ste14
MKLSWLLVVMQFVVPTMLVLTFRLNHHTLGYLLISMAGVALHIVAMRSLGKQNLRIMPQPRPEGSLVRCGPYRYVRHPMYLALLLFCLGFTFTPFAAWKPFAWLVLLATLIAKARIEEVLLRQRFEEYDAYAIQTWMLLPPIF